MNIVQIIRKAASPRTAVITGTLLSALAIPAVAHAATATDSTAAIQSLLDTPVNLPSGTFTIRPALRLTHGEKIVGHNTTLVVAAGSGDYAAVLAGASASTDLSGLSITGVTFNQNSASNPIASAQALYHGTPRFVILVTKGAGITISGNTFTGSAMYDSAAIEVHGSQVTVTGNTVSGYFRAANIVATGTTISGNTN